MKPNDKIAKYLFDIFQQHDLATGVLNDNRVKSWDSLSRESKEPFLVYSIEILQIFLGKEEDIDEC